MGQILLDRHARYRLTSRMRGFTIDELRTLLAATRQAEYSKALIEGEAHEVEP